MKKLLITALSLISVLSFGQDMKEKQSQFPTHHIASRELEIKEKSNVLIYRTDVKIDVENLKAEADSVFFNESNKTMVVYGVSKLLFSGGETVINKNSKNPTTIRYKLNDKIIYVE